MTKDFREEALCSLYHPIPPRHGNNYHLSTFKIPDSLSLLLMRLLDDL